MTRNTSGGETPHLDAWEQAEATFLGEPVTQMSPWLTAYLNDGKPIIDLDERNGCWSIARAIPAFALASAVLLSSSLLGAPDAAAQTAFGSTRRPVSTTPPPATTAPQQAQNNVPAAPPMPAMPSADLPVSSAVVRQAEAQIDGNFPAMKRAEVGGQIQDAWNEANPRDGVQNFRLCDDCVYKVRTREFMTTTVILPNDAKIATADLGDPNGFQVKVKAANMVAVRPVSYGMDTNLTIYTESGRVYPIYVRAESFNSKNVPDVLVKIVGQEAPPKIETIAVEPAPGAPGDEGRREKDDAPGAEKKSGGGETKGDKIASAVEAMTNPKAAPGDFVQHEPFDPSELHGWRDYKLWGGGDDADELKPVAVFRDKKFTYLQYGRKYPALELPTAYVTRDGIDELVGSRVQGTTYIVEATARLITLKNGKSYVCIQYTGEQP